MTWLDEYTERINDKVNRHHGGFTICREFSLRNMLTVQVHSVVARGGSASVLGDAWFWPVLVVSDATAAPAAMAGRPSDEGSVVVGEPFQAKVSSRPNIGRRVRRHQPLVTFEVEPSLGSLSPRQIRVGLAVLLTVGDPRSPATAAAVARFKQDLEQAVSVELAGQMGMPDLDGLLAGKTVSADPEAAKQRFEALLNGDEVAVESDLATLERGAVHKLLAIRSEGELARHSTEMAVLSRLATDPAAAASIQMDLEVPRRDGGTGGLRTNPATSTGVSDGPLNLPDTTTATTLAQPFRLALSPDLRFRIHTGFQPPATTVMLGRPPLINAIRPSVSVLALSSVNLAALDVAGLVAASADTGHIVASSFQSWSLAELEKRGNVVFRRVLKAPLTRRLSFQVKGAVASTIQASDVVDSGAGVAGLAHLARLADGRVNLLASSSLIMKPVDLSAVAGGLTAAGSPVAGTDGGGRALVAWRGPQGEVVGVGDDGQGGWKNLGLQQAIRGAKAGGALSLHTAGDRTALVWRQADGKVRLGLGDARGRWISAKGPDVVLSGDPVVTSLQTNKLFLLAGVDRDHHLRVWTQSRRQRWKEIDIPGGSNAVGRPGWAVAPEGTSLWLCARTQTGGVNLLRRKRDSWGRPLDLIALANAPSVVSDPSLVLWQGHPVVAVLGDDLTVYILASRPGLGWSRRALSASLGITEPAGDPSLEVSGKQLLATWATASGRIISASRTASSDWTLTSGVAQ